MVAVKHREDSAQIADDLRDEGCERQESKANEPDKGDAREGKDAKDGSEKHKTDAGPRDEPRSGSDELSVLRHARTPYAASERIRADLAGRIRRILSGQQKSSRRA